MCWQQRPNIRHISLTSLENHMNMINTSSCQLLHKCNLFKEAECSWQYGWQNELQHHYRWGLSKAPAAWFSPRPSRLLDDRGPLRKGKSNQKSLQLQRCVLLLEGEWAMLRHYAISVTLAQGKVLNVVLFISGEDYVSGHSERSAIRLKGLWNAFSAQTSQQILSYLIKSGFIC